MLAIKLLRTVAPIALRSGCDVLPERRAIGATVLGNFMARNKALVNAAGMTHLTQTVLKSK